MNKTHRGFKLVNLPLQFTGNCVLLLDERPKTTDAGTNLGINPLPQLLELSSPLSFLLAQSSRRCERGWDPLRANS